MAFRTNKTPDLQEKSASGAVATFNTALAMPLASCNIAVNAWQEGSGDPSPDNIRPIHGVSVVNTYKRGVNLWDEQWELGAYWNDTGLPRDLTDRIRCKNFILVKGGITIYIPRNMAFFFFNKEGNAIDAGAVAGYTHVGVMYIRQSGEQTGLFLTPQNAVSMKFYMQATYGTTYNHDISINYPSTDKNYHAYTGNTYTIQLGQEVYGAEVDVVNGVAHVTHKRSIIPTITSFSEISGVRFTSYSPSDILRVNSIKNDIISEVGYGRGYNKNFSVVHNSINVIHTVDDTYTVEDYNANIAGNYDVYPLATPFDIQLTPTQIATLIGNNTIFADTGDVDLTYKDLDIAKRGNFREVFKLPS